MNNAREVVVKALLQMEQRDAWSNITLDTALGRSSLSQQDKGFASALFYGTLSRKLTLGACIQAHSKRSLNKLDGRVRIILETALYQLLYMDSVPDHSAVDESVNLTRTLRVASASGFVNGVLRSFLRSKKEVPFPKGSLSHQMEIEYSCPSSLINLFLEDYGEEKTREILAASLGAPSTFLRVNSLKTTAEELILLLKAQGIVAETHPALPSCLRVTSGSGVHSSPLLEQGYFHIQDSSSQWVAHAVGATPEEQILDSCAAPGGKTFILAENMNNTGRLVACDLHEHRLNELIQRSQTLGLTNITTYPLDMKELHPELGSFDRILCDVPCSGLGVLRRRPEIKYKSLATFARLPEIQYEILKTSAKYCKKNGLLVYSTCTLSSFENEKVVQKFLQNHPHFRPTAHREPWEQTLFPDALGGDGFYLAVLQHV